MRVILAFLITFSILVLCHAQQASDGDVRRRLFAPKIKLEPCDMPPSVDNSNCKYFPPVISQSGGSCAQASGIGYMFTYEINRLLDRDASASAENRFSYLFSWNMLNGGHDEGGFVDEGLDLAKRYGIMTEADYGFPYTYAFRWASGYDKYLNAFRYRVRDIYSFADSVPLMKRWLYDAGDGSSRGGVLTFSGMSSGWRIDNDYQGPSLTGYRSLLTALPTSGSHAMTIVGYDDTVSYTDAQGVTHTGAFIVCNSWGTFSHDNGRYYYPYDFFRDPTISTSVLSDKVNAITVRIHQPLVVFKVRIAYSSRDDLHFTMTTTTEETADAKPASLKWRPVAAFYNAGGDYPMQGSYADETIELAMDYTDYMTSAQDDYYSYRLNIIRSLGGNKKGSGRLLSLSVIDYRYGAPQESVYEGQLPIELKDGNNYFDIRNQADAIGEVSAAAPSSSDIYDLQGRKVTPGTLKRPGLYITGGRKVLY